MKKAIVLMLAMLTVVSLFGGCFHEHVWEEATCTTPRTCTECGWTMGNARGHMPQKATCEEAEICAVCKVTISDARGHDWVAPTCETPKHCETCGETVGEASGHNWLAGTCKEPRSCKDCGKTDGTLGEHDWSNGKCRFCGETAANVLPESGHVFLGAELERDSQLTIIAAETESCYVKLKDQNDVDVFAFFVRAGDEVSVDVPMGEFYVYFASGTQWYGVRELFGSETGYSKDDEICDFENYTWTYTLEPTTDGNFSETPIGADDF